MQPIERKPKEQQQVDDVFAGIERIPQWRIWAEIVCVLGAILYIGEIILRLVPS